MVHNVSVLELMKLVCAYEKTHLFSERSLRLSRACRGEIITFSIKLAQNTQKT